MKQTLLFIIVILSGLNLTLAHPSQSSFEETTWNVIRERLFNGENAKAYRFEDDIRFQLIGANTHQDSAVFIQMIAELNDLLETIQIKMVETDPNFKLTIIHEAGGLSSSSRRQTSGSSIIYVDLKLGIPGTINEKETIKHIYYHTFRKLTEIYSPQHASTGYGGIFDSPKAADAEFKEIDKELLRKLYSTGFYENLKENTVRKFGYSYYLNLRFHKLLKIIPNALKAILILFGFMFFLSKAAKRKQNPGLFSYIKQRATILFILPFIFSFYRTSYTASDYDPLLLFSPTDFGINYLITFSYAVFILIVFYFTEPIFLKRIDNFVGKQAFIFLSTIIIPFLVSTTSLFIYILFWNKALLSGFSPLTFFTHDPSFLLKIIFVATLRVFYNIVNYRIQSMVNQKDVEIARMKALKNQAELNALHSRINPHFLYNSLNSIASLAHINADKTENMATGLSELFRYSINQEDKTFVTVAEELDMVKKYLEIEKTRFGDRLSYEINTNKDTLDKQIPKFLIQPLVENAIKHGLSKIKNSGKVRVETVKKGKDLILSVYDNGPDFPEEPVSGYGLQNLYDKLDIIYGNKASINWENGEQKQFRVTLKNQFEQ
ncbi:histidine kinase [Echinicola sp. CAU 1574]|uniref:Histidine kinase n=1 Tax=Echinicola arenosa TaxID=2774144 RepID=A0ABR9AH99_9BACT|nr:histidine kinase [Echinicola arenosa]MBD8487697.1 histidine kinase [Echinicola arenosa]